MRKLLLLALFGCHSASVDLPDLAPLPDLADPGPQPHLPAVTDHGGASLDAAETWTFVWGGDEANGQYLDNFFTDLFADDRYWTSLLSQYGVGAGQAHGV